MLAFSVVRHVVHFLLEALLQGQEHLLQLPLLGSDKVQLRFQAHLILFDSVDRIAQCDNLENDIVKMSTGSLASHSLQSTFSPLLTKRRSHAATDEAWLRKTFSCSSRSTDHLLIDSSSWRKVRADPVGAAGVVVLVVVVAVEALQDVTSVEKKTKK